MEAKLKKTGNQFILYSDKKEVLAITEGSKEGRMLSLKNCEAIERGYDLDELASDIDSEKVRWSTKESLEHFGYMIGIKDGFQKALEILGDKKFSEREVRRGMLFMLDKCLKLGADDVNYVKIKDEYIESLQQTEWDVEIVTEPYVKYINRSVYPPLGIQNKLDTEGNLILKRK